MSSTEDYLDRLLKQATGEWIPEDDFPILEDLPNLEDVKIPEETPNVVIENNFDTFDEMPQDEDALTLEDIPSIDDIQSIDDTASYEENPEAENAPETEEILEVEDIPDAEEILEAEEIPESEGILEAEEILESEEILETEETSENEDISEIEDFSEIGDIENNSSMPDLGEISDLSDASETETGLEDEDISNLLKELEGMSEEVEESEETSNLEDESLESLLADSDDIDLTEIGDILDKEENDILLDEAQDVEEDFTSGNMSEEELFDFEDVISDEENNKSKGKKKKGKKSGDEEVSGEKKPGLIDKILGFFSSLTKDAEEDASLDVFAEESATDLALEGAIENDIALKELEEEDAKAGSSEKKKKEKKKKEKKKKEPDPKAQEKAAAKASAKAKKKAEREAKKAEAAKIPTKKLPKKKVIPIYILCFSLGVAITLLAYIVPSKLDKKKAFECYQNGNYEETYVLLKGNRLNEKEKLAYDRAVVLLKEQRKLDSYNNYMSLGMKAEALNALVQGAKEASELRENAETLGVGTQFDSIYRNIIEELNNSFGVSEDKVEEWIQIDDLEEYTLTLNRYLNRTVAGDTVDNKTEDQIIAGEESEIENENEPFIENEPDDNADFDEVIAAEEAEF